MTEIDGPVLLQGGEGSFHDQVADHFEITERDYMTDFDSLYAALRTEAGRYAIVAASNNTMGRVNESYSQLLVGDLSIIGQVDWRVTHSLWAPQGATHNGIKYIHTQEPAYLQCEQTMIAQYPEAIFVPESDTAGSAAIVKRLGTRHAAITPRQAGQSAGLICLGKTVQDRPDNATTFYVVTNRPLQFDPIITPYEATVAILQVDSSDAYDTISRRYADNGITMALSHRKEQENLRTMITLTSGEPVRLPTLNGLGKISIIGQYPQPTSKHSTSTLAMAAA